MAEKRLRVGERLKYKAALPIVGTRPPHPEQWIAGHYGGKWEIESKEERHRDIAAQEALTAMQSFKGPRLRMAIQGAHTGQRFKSEPGDGKTLQVRDAVMRRGSQQEKELEQIVKDVAQYKRDRRAYYQGLARSGKLSRSGAGFAREDVKRYEQERMVEWASKVSGLDYVRVHTIAFAPAPLPPTSRKP